jgi:hypothetical protein
MEPLLGDGWLIPVATSRAEPQAGDVVAVHIYGAGDFIGYWGCADRAALLKANPAHAPLELWPRGFRIVGMGCPPSSISRSRRRLRPFRF